MDKAAANQFDRFERLYRENKFDALLKEKEAGALSAGLSPVPDANAEYSGGGV